MSEPPVQVDPPQYATTPDVIAVLGKLGPRVERAQEVDLSAHLDIATAEALDVLHRSYGRTVPAFAGAGLESVRWAVAKLAAASVLDILRASLDSVSDLPERLRASALRALGSVPGYPPGDGVPGPGPGEAPGGVGLPVGTDFTPLSNFADPYADARDPAVRPLAWDSEVGWIV